jgi:hypothetical protein
MPQGGAKLTADEIDALTRWIVDGAFDPRESPPDASELEQATSWSAIAEKRREWWSFQPLRRVDVPRVTSEVWSADPIDRFLLAAMEREGLVPAEDAPREALVRRLAYVLTGLPPTPAEVTAFLADGRPNAYEEWVDHYLKSPGFGERWARHWMDWIRYAESHGSEGDPAIPDAWRYRDYLIRALNADVPCNQLIREHIAGDLIAEQRYNPDLMLDESPIGTSQLRMVFHGFAPTDAQDERVRFTDDAINTITKAFMGLTVSCARCHDHKFDPISQEDYFALYGVFTNPRPGRLVIDSEEKQRHNYDALVQLKKEIRDQVGTAWQARIDSLDTAAIAKLMGVDLQEVNLSERWSEANQKWRRAKARREDMKRLRSSGGTNDVVDLAGANKFSEWYRYGLGVNETVDSKGDLLVALEGEQAIAAILPEGVASQRISSKHPGVVTSADFIAQPGQVLWLLMAGEGNATSRYVVENYPRDGTVYPTTTWQATAGGTRWRWQRYDIGYWAGDAVHVEVTTARDAPVLDRGNERSGFVVRDCLLLPPGQSPEETTDGEEFWPYDCSPADEQKTGSSSDVLSQYLRGVTAEVIGRWRSESCSDQDVLLLDRLLREGILENDLTQLDAVAPLVQRYRGMEAEIAVPTRITGVLETKGSNARLMVRGDHRNLAAEVPRRFLSVCQGEPWDTSASGRLELADAMVRDSNPLTPRVMVNRVWHHVFGKGLVDTPDNLGRLGSEPSHPELLDYLACRFVDDHWSLQRLVRSLVMTRAFRMSVQANELASQVDPGNRLLSHASIRRLEAESIRDGMLAVSGILDRTRFGPPVENSQRRSIYLPVRRNSLEPLLRVFDFPEPFSCTGRRDVTNVPAQALTLLNSPEISQWAEQWASSVVNGTQGQSDQERAEGMWRGAFGRLPTQWEKESIQQFLTRQESAHQHFVQQRAALLEHQRSLLDEQAQLWSEVKKRLPLSAAKDSHSITGSPVFEWNFREQVTAGEEIRIKALQTVGDAFIDAEGLHVHGNGYAISTPLGQQVVAKSLEAVVKISNYDQGGGGVLSLQSQDGVIFDAIVYGERESRQWMAGSNGFERTESFAGESEQEAVDQPVHIAIVYDTEGNVRGFRNGVPYGSVYRARSPVVFGAGESVVTLGLRHLPSGGNRMLSGTIYHARVWDRALTEDEVNQLASGAVGVVTRRDLELLLTEEELVRLRRSEETLRGVLKELNQLPGALAEDDARWRWAELAKAIFNMKEFIYIP